MPVLTRSALEASPLADLHALAAELGLDGYRRLRKADLIGRIIERQGGEPDAPEEEAAEAEAPEAEAVEASADADADADVDAEADEEAKPRRRRGSRGGRSRRRDADEEGTTDEDAGDAAEAPAEAPAAGRVVEGVLELLPNGSGFVRVSPPDPSEDDVYVSAAQVRRCELVSGDTVTGPVREPRRSERYPSLVRIDTINGRPADEVAEGTHFDDLPTTLPTERLALGSEDATLKAIEWLTPLGKGSRATIVGEQHAGKTEALRRLAGALGGQEGLEVQVVLVGVRPEETSEWREGDAEPVVAVTFGTSAEAAGQAVERAIDTAKRITARGGDVVLLVDSLDTLDPALARRAMAAARNIVDGGSLTIIGTATAPLGGETTVIALDRALTRTGRFPALDLVASGTMRPELLVGDAGADAIAQARAQALGA